MQHPFKENIMGILKNRIRTFFGKPQNIILLIFGIMLTFSTVAPVVAIVKDTLQIHPGTIDQHLTGKASGYSIVNYIDLFTGSVRLVLFRDGKAYQFSKAHNKKLS